MVSLSNREDVYGSPSSSKLLAWCSLDSNQIKVVELEGKQEEYATFEGVQLHSKGTYRYRVLRIQFFMNYGGDNCWPHVKEIPGTKLLISLHHSVSKCANIEVFNLGNKGRPRKIYSFDEVIGCMFASSIIIKDFFIPNLLKIDTKNNNILLR